MLTKATFIWLKKYSKNSETLQLKRPVFYVNIYLKYNFFLHDKASKQQHLYEMYFS